jgi:hypothetical protein
MKTPDQFPNNFEDENQESDPDFHSFLNEEMNANQMEKFSHRLDGDPALRMEFEDFMMANLGIQYFYDSSRLSLTQIKILTELEKKYPDEFVAFQESLKNISRSQEEKKEALRINLIGAKACMRNLLEKEFTTEEAKEFIKDMKDRKKDFGQAAIEVIEYFREKN